MKALYRFSQEKLLKYFLVNFERIFADYFDSNVSHIFADILHSLHLHSFVKYFNILKYFKIFPTENISVQHYYTVILPWDFWKPIAPEIFWWISCCRDAVKT